MSNILHIDKEYQLWIQELSKRFRRSQIKAAVKVNQEMPAFYWDYANLSQDLRHAIPDTDGFSDTSIRYAKRFYKLYFQLIKNLPQVGNDKQSYYFAFTEKNADTNSKTKHLLRAAGSNAFTLSPSRWIDLTNAIGIVCTTGRNGGKQV